MELSTNRPMAVLRHCGFLGTLIGICTVKEPAMSEVSSYIDEHFDETIERLTRWCSQPSISTENIGVEEMAALAVEELRAEGYDVQVHPTDRHPVIVASM